MKMNPIAKLFLVTVPTISMVILGSVLLLSLSMGVLSCKSIQKEEQKQEIESAIKPLESKKGGKFDHRLIFYIVDPRIHACYAVHPHFGMAEVTCTQKVLELAIRPGDNVEELK